MIRLFSTTVAVIFLAMASGSMAQTPAGSGKAPAGKTGLTAGAQPPFRDNGTLDADGEAPRHLRDALALVKQLTASNTSYRQGKGYPDIVWHGQIRAYCDCSGFMDLLFMHSYGYTAADLKSWLGSERPKAKQIHDAIAEGKDGKLTRITRLSDVQPGDILAVKYAKEKPQHTGHVMLVEGIPREITPGQPGGEGGVKKWLVPVIDSSMSGHGKQDSRKIGGTSHTGVGKGMLCVYTNAQGEVVAYTWSPEPTGTTYRQASYHMVIGRLVVGPT